MAITTLLDFHKMVAPAKCAQLAAGAGKFGSDNRQVCKIKSAWYRGHEFRTSGATVVFEAKRHHLLQGAVDVFELLVAELTQTGGDRTHAAADIHADPIGNNRAFSGQNPANGHAVTDMGIGHQGDMVEGKGKVGQIFRLAQGLLFQIVHPEQDR